MNTKSVGNAMQAMVRAMLAQVHTAMPAQIEAYDYATRKADVQPLIKQVYSDGTIAAYPVISAVPVVMPAGGGAVIKLPVAVGDVVLLVCCERSLDKWLQTGGMSTPTLNHKFQLMDAVAIAGLFPFSESSPATDADSLEILYRGASVQITAGGQVRINGDHLTVD